MGDPYLTWTDSTGNAFPTDPSRTITGLEEGIEYKAKVRATYAGTSGDWSGEITITVARSANNPPTADAGTAQTVQEGDTVTLSATASDQDGDQLTYSWRHDSSLEMILTGADSLAPSFTAPQVRGNTTITFTLTADDGMENGTDTVQVTVLDEPANNPPSVDAGEPVAVSEGAQVTLNATASDQDGDQLTYSWNHDSALGISLANAASLSPTFTAPQVSANTTVAFTLTADDGTDTHSDTVTVTILDVPVVGTPNGGSGQNTTAVLNPDGPLGPRDIGRITLTSDTPGAIEAIWVTPSETPAGYRISWAQVGDPYLTWTDSTGNAFPTDPSRTITGLEEGIEYKAKVRATYAGTSGDWSGDATITTFTLMLTADDGTQPATDTLNVTVNETGAAFVTTWTASNSDRSITLPMEGTYSILWGDGSNSTDVSGSQSHTYGAAGNYTVTVLGDGLEHIYMYGDAANARQLMSIEQWGGTKWTTMYGAFGSAANMVYRATDTPDLSGVTDMTYMFTNAHSFDGDLSAWDVSEVTDMFATTCSTTRSRPPSTATSLPGTSKVTHMKGD